VNKNKVNKLGTVLCILAAFAAMPAEAQAIIGGAAGLGVMGGAWSWFQSNMMMALVAFGIASIGVLLLASRFHMGVAFEKVAGAVILVNAIAIGAAVVSGAGILN
jgi:hypothetical protein